MYVRMYVYYMYLSNGEIHGIWFDVYRQHTSYLCLVQSIDQLGGEFLTTG